MRKVDANWYEGRIGDRKGIVPSSYLDVFSEPEVKGMFVLEEAAHYVKFFCCKKLGQVTIHFRQKKSRHFINQSNLKLNPVVSCLTAFSRAAGS